MSKLRKSYRLEETADVEIKRVAGLGGISEAEVIEHWARVSAGNGGVRNQETEKKLGDSGRVLPKVAGTFTADKLAEVKPKDFVGKGGASINLGTGRITGPAVGSLALQRANALPMLKPGQNK